MSSKTSLKGVFKSYLETLYSYEDDRISLSDIKSQIGMPVLFGILIFFGISFNSGIESSVGKFFPNAMTVMSIISALTCDVALQLFSIRSEMGLESAENAKTKQDDLQLIDELYDGVLWAIVSGFLSVGLMATYGIFPNSSIINSIVAGMSIAMLFHSLQVSRMCIKRLHAIYHIIAKFWHKKGAV